jgi:hypothetical protein
MKKKQRSTRCQALTKAGEPCGAAATKTGLCHFHGNPKKASELGRIVGSRTKRVLPVEVLGALPDLKTAKDVQELNLRLLSEMYSGNLDPRVVNVAARQLDLSLRAIEAIAHEEKLEALTCEVADLKKEFKVRQPKYASAEAEAKRGEQLQ